MRSVRLLELAATEAAEAAAWYETQRAGLGYDFREEFRVALDLLRQDPTPGRRWPGRLGERGVIRIAMKRFPFFLVFLNVNSESVVLAVAHHRRRPAYWSKRTSDVKPP
jgi:plasmid stabilization system protein ParE